MIKNVFYCIIASSLILSCSSARLQRLDDGKAVYAADKKELKSQAAIEGRVIDSRTGKGISGARVEIKNANMGLGYFLRITDSGGRFKIDDFLTRIHYMVEISADGYVTYRSQENISEGTHEIKLNPEALITGMVKDTSGNPMKGVEVKLKSRYSGYENRDGKTCIVETDSAGGYRFTKLGSGGYGLTFSKQGYISETALIENVREAEIFMLPMVLFRPSSITGKILIEGLNVPAVNMNVTTTGRYTYSASTYEDGTFQIEDLKPGYYELNLAHEGFHAHKTRPIKISENEQIRNIELIVTPKKAKVSLYSYRYTYVPGGKIDFNLTTFRLETVKVTVYSVPVGLLMRGGVDPDALFPAEEKLKIAAQWDEPINDFRPYEWRYQSLEIKRPLPTGGYCIEAQGGDGTVSRKFFTVTSVGTVVKRSQNSVFVYAANLITNEPVGNAEVAVFDTWAAQAVKGKKKAVLNPTRIEELPVDIVMRGKTDAKGIFHKNSAAARQLSVLVVSPDGSYAICNSGAPSSFEQEKNKYFIYTDRPVYRAGDTVYYKIIGKIRGRKFFPLEKKAVFYKIQNREYQSVLEEGSAALDEWGTIHGKIRLAEDCRLGEHEISVGPAKDKFYHFGKFYVEQYRKPEFFIEVKPSKDYFINGDTVEFKVDAKYFFGAPLKGALVKFRFYETRLRDTNTTYWWEEEEGGSLPYNKIRLEGEKYTDENGIAVVRLSAGNYPYDREISLEATITDKSNVSISSKSSVRIGRGEFYIKIMPSRNFFAETDKKEIEIQTLTHTGKPVSAGVELNLLRYVWKPVQRVYVHDARPLFSQKVTTDKKGIAKIELPKKFPYYGEFDCIASAVDRRENKITASRIIWLYSTGGSSVASKLKNLELVLSSTEMSAGGPVTCIVKSRFADSYVCLTLEGRDVYDSKVVRMAGNILAVDFNVKPEYAPNLYVYASMQRNRALYTAAAGISIADSDTVLSINVKTDRAEYRPGDKAKVILEVKDQSGKPIRADLSLAAVDESIYQIRPDHTPKMLDFFYTKISNWVLTSYSYPITLLAGASKGPLRKDVREKFEDTAFWQADIRTDDRGFAAAEIKLPDNLTTWRLTSRGHDREGRVGEKVSRFLVTQEVIARIGKPRFFVEGDTVNLIGIVNSNTKEGIADISASLKADGKKLDPDQAVKISLPGFGSARNYYLYNVPENLSHVSLLFSAMADSGPGDALKLTVPVERRGAPYKLFGIGDMVYNKKVTVAPLRVSGDFDFVPQNVSISVNPSPIVQMIKAVKMLSEYPYGCIEQTLNRFIPDVALQRLLQQKGYNEFMHRNSVKELPEKVAAGIARVQNMQNEDGTWGWWSGDRGNEFMTGYVLYSLYLARQSGYAVSQVTVNSGLAAVTRILKNHSNTDIDAVAYLLYIQALWGGWDHAAYKYLVKEKNQSAYEQSFLIRAMALALRMGKLEADHAPAIREEMPKKIMALKELMKKDSLGVYWESHDYDRWGWQGGAAETSAHVLAALVEAGDTSTIPSQLVRSISMRAKGSAWNSTKETATVILAFCKYLEVMPSASKGLKGNVSFRLDSKKIAEMSYEIRSADDLATLTKKVSVSDVKPGSSFVIEAEGEANPDMSFDVTIAGTIYFRDRGFLSLFKSGEKSLETLSNGIKITRGFVYLTRVLDMNRNEYFVPQSISDKTEINIGDEILVKVKFRAGDSFKYMVLEDYLPSGFEVTKTSAYENNQPFVHAERWDNRMVFFFTDIDADTEYELAYIIRAELPGKFMVKPTRIECMYEPTIQGWSFPAIIDVKKK